MLRLKQLGDSFKSGYKHVTRYNEDIKAQYSDLVLTSAAGDNLLVLVQTGIDTLNRPVIYVREVEKEGLNEEAQRILAIDGGKKHEGHIDQAHSITIHLQENILEDNKEPEWKAVPDPQAKLWVQIGDFIYFYVVTNDFKNKTT